MSHHRCCDCGGGGDDCCVCGLCFFDPDAPGWTGGEATLSAVVTVTGGGVDSGCCDAFGPSGSCTESEIAVARETVVFAPTAYAALGCEAFGVGETSYDLETYDCEFVFHSQPVEEVFSFQSAVTSQAGCPGFYLPPSGAIMIQVGSASGVLEPMIVVWGGSRCIGPLVLTFAERWMTYNLGGVASTIPIFAVAGAGGGSAFIAMIKPMCLGWPCEGGCVVDQSERFPYRIDGGGSIDGELSCTGEYAIGGSFNAAYTTTCESDSDPACAWGDDELGGRCVKTGPFSVNFDFSIGTHFGGLLSQCSPTPERDGGGPEGDDPDDPANQVVVPQAWLNKFPDLKRAVDAIRASLGPGTDQAPPPRPVGPDRRSPGDFF